MEALERAFKSAGNFIFNDRTVLQQCRELAENHRLNNEDIAQRYDAFSAFRYVGLTCHPVCDFFLHACTLVSRDFKFEVSSSNMTEFTKFLEKEMNASKQATAKPRIVVRGWEE